MKKETIIIKKGHELHPLTVHENSVLLIGTENRIKTFKSAVDIMLINETNTVSKYLYGYINKLENVTMRKVNQGTVKGFYIYHYLNYMLQEENREMAMFFINKNVIVEGSKLNLGKMITMLAEVVKDYHDEGATSTREKHPHITKPYDIAHKIMDNIVNSIIYISVDALHAKGKLAYKYDFLDYEETYLVESKKKYYFLGIMKAIVEAVRAIDEITDIKKTALIIYVDGYSQKTVDMLTKFYNGTYKPKAPETKKFVSIIKDLDITFKTDEAQQDDSDLWDAVNGILE